MRQGANSAVRFTTYTTLKQSVQSRTRTGQTLPTSVTFGMGAVAGLVTVYTTMPLECVMSSSDCIQMERNAYFCAPFFLSHQCDQDPHAGTRRSHAIS
jgi:solute carrier family 25 (mitochondrial citrate transporter), member 1